MERQDFDSFVNDFALATGLLVRRLRAASISTQCSWTQRAVISRLAKGGDATISDLARAECVKPQSMGTTVAQLEEDGLVERRPHPTDGRQVYIALTDKGVALCEQVRMMKLAWLSECVGKLNYEEQETLFKASEIIKRLAEL
jgi:DNA-binding MarR family transcriptional regulator